MTQRHVERKELVIEHENWRNPRLVTGLAKDDIKELAADLKKNDIQDDLMVVRVKNGSDDPAHFLNLVVDGQRRFIAAGVAGISDIPIVDITERWLKEGESVLDLTPELAKEIMLSMLAVGNFREGLSSWELVEVAKKLRDQNATVKQIGHAIRKDDSWVSRFLDAEKNATPELLKQWKADKVPDEAFKELAQIRKPDDQTTLLKKYTKLRDEKDPGTARQLVKEAAEEAKASRPVEKSRPGPKPKAKAKATKEADGPRSPGRSMIEEIATLEKGKTIMDPYVRGLVHGCQYSIGTRDPKKFEKPWHRYLAKMEGKSTTKVKTSKPKAKAKAKAKK